MPSDPPRVSHNFEINKLSYDSLANIQPYIRINMFFKKKEGISWEYFTTHWHHVHADICLSTKAWQENNILRYTQFYQSPESRKKTSKLFAAYPDPLLEWDACSEFWVEKVEDFANFLKSEEYVKSLREFHSHFFPSCMALTVVLADCEHFINLDGGMKIMVGPHTLIYGETVPSMGKNGVVEADLKH
jgi:hypothetical protein